MKKTLAILLALLAAASISLAACDEDNERTPIGGENGDDIEQVEDSDDEVTEDTKDNNNEDTNDQGGEDVGSNGYVDKSGVVYAGVDLNLRTTDYSTADSTIAKTVPFGTKLNLVASDGTWSKVKLDGDDTVYYALAGLTSAAQVNLTELEEPVAITLSETTANNVLFFNFPFESEDENLYWNNVALASGLKHANLSKDYSLKKVATSNKWAKVEFVGTITVGSSVRTHTAENPGVYYIKDLAFSRGDIVDPTYSSGSGVGGGQG